MADNRFKFLDKFAVKQFSDFRGSLSVIQGEDLPFSPKRFFWITGVPQGVTRGNHGHFKSQQYLCCISGEVQVEIYTPHQPKSFNVNLEKNQAVYLPPLHWVSMKFKSSEDILLVVADRNYDEKDVFMEPIK